MTQPTQSDVPSLKATLDEYGFVVLENLMPRDTALYMASRLIDVFESQLDVAEADQHISAVFDHLTPDDYELFQKALTHPICLELARRTLGEDFQLAEVGARRFKPGAQGLPVHVGEPAGRLKELGIRIPETCFALTFSWMLNDLNKDNGVRLLMPFSHHFGHAPREHFEYPHLAEVEAPAGSILLFNSATWHGVVCQNFAEGYFAVFRSVPTLIIMGLHELTVKVSAADVGGLGQSRTTECNRLPQRRKPHTPGTDGQQTAAPQQRSETAAR